MAYLDGTNILHAHDDGDVVFLLVKISNQNWADVLIAQPKAKPNLAELIGDVFVCWNKTFASIFGKHWMFGVWNVTPQDKIA